MLADQKLYCVYDINNTLLFSHPDRDVVIHEYLSYVKDELLLINTITASKPSKSSFKLSLSLFIQNKKYPIEYDTYVLNYIDDTFVGSTSSFAIPSSFSSHLLYNSIKELISDKKHIIQSNDKSKPKSQNIIKLSDKQKDKQKDKPKINLSRLVPSQGDKQIQEDKKTQKHHMTPVIVTEDNDDDDTLTSIPDMDNIEDIDLDELDEQKLKRQMDALIKLREDELNNIEKLKDLHEEDMQNFTDYHNNLGDKRRTYNRDKDRMNEKRKEFDSDITTYSRIKDHIVQGSLSEDAVPILFADKYPVFKFMEENQLLNKDDSFVVFTELFDKMYDTPQDTAAKDYVPHNINYLSKEEQDKYKNKQHSDKIEDFMANKPSDPYKSLNTVLDNIDNPDTNEISIHEEKGEDDINFEEFAAKQ